MDLEEEEYPTFYRAKIMLPQINPAEFLQEPQVQKPKPRKETPVIDERALKIRKDFEEYMDIVDRIIARQEGRFN